MSYSRLNLSSAASFSEYELQHPFAEGAFRYVAEGVYTNGPRCNQPCVGKWFKSGDVYEETFFAKDLKAVDKAQEIINAFNALEITSRIHLNRPEVWTARAGVHAGKKILVEPFIKDYRKFNSNSGYVGGYDGWSEVMQALSHYSYHKTGGNMVLCDLQGGILSRNRGAVLTDPVILSRTRSYGVTDLGPDGISTFFARHSCGRFCQAHWQRPRNTAVYYNRTASTTMELLGHAARPVGQWQPPIYEEDDYYDDDDDDEY